MWDLLAFLSLSLLVRHSNKVYCTWLGKKSFPVTDSTENKSSSIIVNRSVFTFLDGLFFVFLSSESMMHDAWNSKWVFDWYFQIRVQIILEESRGLKQRAYLGTYRFPIKITKGIINVSIFSQKQACLGLSVCVCTERQNIASPSDFSCQTLIFTSVSSNSLAETE